MFVKFIVCDSLLNKTKNMAKDGGERGRRDVRVSLIPIRSRTRDATDTMSSEAADHVAAGAPEPLMPPLVLGAFITCVVGAAALANCALLAAVIKRTKTGLFSILGQLAIVDILLGIIIWPELWSINSSTWIFGNHGCSAHHGLNVFASTLSTYLVISISLHSLTTLRLEENVAQKKIKRKIRDEEEMQSSQHSLVNSDSSTPPRTMNVDYRMADVRVPVALPTACLWILAVSLSVPEFVLATTYNIGKHKVACALDFSHQFNMQTMLIIFCLVFPLFLISTTSAIIIIKLLKKSCLDAGCESVAALKLSLLLMCVQLIFCIPRTVISAYNVYSTSTANNSALGVIVDQDDSTIKMACLSLSIAYLVATLVRPLLSITSLAQIRKVFHFRGQSDSV